MNFNQRKTQLRTNRLAAVQQSIIRQQITSQLLGIELRLRGFFPSHTKVHEIVHEILKQRDARHEKIIDDSAKILKVLYVASNNALKRGDIVSQKDLNAPSFKLTSYKSPGEV